MTSTTGANGTSTEGDATPSAANSGDATTSTQQASSNSVTDALQTVTPASTRSDDTRGAGYDFTKLLDSLDSLPDRVANAVREAAPAPVTQSAPAKSDDSANNGTTASDQGNGAGANNGGQTTARKKSFAEKWFGL